MELIVVDDGSTDGTGRLIGQISDPRVTVRHHPRNRGKGAALMTATSIATGTYILPFDADLEYAPEDIPKMLSPVLQGRTHVVYGARLFGRRAVYQSYRYVIGNRLLTTIANLLFNANLSDLHTCLKLMPLDMFKRMGLRESGFGLDTELTASLLRAGIRPFEVPVSYHGRSRIAGKKITWRDALRCVWILLRVRAVPSSRLPSVAVAAAEPLRASSGETARGDLARVSAFDPVGSDDAVVAAAGQLRAVRS